jgi:hypothetical protein
MMAKDCRSGDGESLRQAFAISVLTCGSSRAVDTCTFCSLLFDFIVFYPRTTFQHHYYQPLWTLVGGGVRKFEESRRSMKSLIPSGVEWIPENAATFDPDRNTVATNKGTVVEYDYLVVATGLQLRYEAVSMMPQLCAAWWARHRGSPAAKQEGSSPYQVVKSQNLIARSLEGEF